MHRVIYNQGDQTLRHVPRLHRRVVRPASATYSLEDLRLDDDASDRVVGSGAASYDTGDTTTTAAAGPAQADPTLVAVDSASGITEGRKYVIEKAPHREVFVLKGLSGTNLYARHDLQHDYASGATVKSAELKATFPSAEAADEDNVRDGEGPYQVTWTYTVGGEVHHFAEPVWLSRYSVAPILTVADVLRAYPRMTQRAPGLVEEAIDAATEDLVAELESAGLNVPYYRTAVVGRVACREKALAYLFEWGGTSQDLEVSQRHQEAYERQLGNLTTGKHPKGTVVVDVDADRAPSGSADDYMDNLLARP